MTIEEIKELIQVVRDTGIAELEVRRGENSVRIKGIVSQPEVPQFAVPVAAAPASFATTGVHPSAHAPHAATAEHVAAAKAEDDRNIVVKSPIVGTYYDSPTPGAAAFVKPGDRVEAKTVLCIIESMKLMNEIEAEVPGIVIAKHLENGRPVEYGESLFTIQPL
jgi:acetyl-CoA carboxylase biotin carboxyl carrier protein